MNATVRSAYALLEWARTPGYHGGRNPYCRDDVIQAERTVAAAEGREVEAFARRWSEEHCEEAGE